MKPIEYRKSVMVHLPTPRVAEGGLKAALGTKKNLNISNAIIGLSKETGELLIAFDPFIRGFPLTPEMRTNARLRLGDCGFYLAALSRELKFKMPSFTKHPRTKETMTANLLALDHQATGLLKCFHQAFYGTELDVEKAHDLAAEAFDLAAKLAWQFFEVPIGTIIEENYAKLLSYKAEEVAASEAKPDGDGAKTEPAKPEPAKPAAETPAKKPHKVHKVQGAVKITRKNKSKEPAPAI